ncbi:MAG: hypothetical protein HZA04_00195 [Nitrospinae bacterium]|nr:hypothetical protein [Nitrospinota bacterium]
MSKTLAIVPVALLALAVGWIGVSGAVKERPGFCVSCHLDAGTPLHAEKHRRFIQENPQDLAGYHRTKVPGEFACSGCHDGRTIGTKARVVWAEVHNTFLYVFGKFEEPAIPNLALLPDENCEGCHAEMKKERGRFHGFAAHRPRVTVACIACHRAHAAGNARRHYLDELKLAAVCAKCHRNIPAGFSFSATGGQ